MAKKLYVGNLTYETTDSALKDLFGQVGSVVKADIIMDRMTQRSKGFGFVEMSSDEEANAAIEKFNGMEFEGRKLTVNEARPQEPRAPREGGFNRGGDRGGRNW